MCIGRGLCSISSMGGIINNFYYYFLTAFKTKLINKATGTTFLAVTASVINEMVIPLPPLSEQKRIVKKVDEIMSLCDELEKQIQDDGE